MQNNIFIDGGATTTKVYLVSDNNKDIIECNIFDGMNIQTQTNASLQVIEKIANFFNILNYKIQNIYVGMPGIHQFKNKNLLTDLLSKINKEANIIILSDIEIQKKLFCDGDNYLAISFGSGMVMISQVRGIEKISGGWGHIFSDEGSAYSFACTWIKQAIFDYENNVDESNFIKKTLSFFSWKNMQQAKELYNDMNIVKPIFQKFTVDIMLTDFVEYEIEIDLVLEIMKNDFFNYFDRIKFDSKIEKIILLGGMIKNNHFYNLLKNAFIERGYMVEKQ